MKQDEMGRLVFSGVAGAVVLTLVGYTLARRKRQSRERADRPPHRVLLEDSKRKAAGGASTPRSSLRSIPEGSFSRR